MGFAAVARHRSKNVTLYRQGDVNFIVNAEPESFAQALRAAARPVGLRHRLPREGRGLRLQARAVELGAWAGATARSGRWSSTSRRSRASAVSLIYLVDRYGDAQRSTTSTSCRCRASISNPAGVGLTYIDHLTHNVHRGRMAEWAEFYERLFNFREIRYFDIEGKLTGLKSKAMTSPCGKIRIPINESADDKSQIAGISRGLSRRGHPAHRARHRRHLSHGRGAARAAACRSRRCPTPTTSRSTRACRATARTSTRLPRDRILIDGAPTKGGGLLLQIFTETVIGPIFFEIIQRKGNEGFGEGNFRALFESIELDQIRRGVLKA